MIDRPGCHGLNSQVAGDARRRGARATSASRKAAPDGFDPRHRVVAKGVVESERAKIMNALVREIRAFRKSPSRRARPVLVLGPAAVFAACSSRVIWPSACSAATPNERSARWAIDEITYDQQMLYRTEASEKLRRDTPVRSWRAAGRYALRPRFSVSLALTSAFALGRMEATRQKLTLSVMASRYTAWGCFSSS